MILLGPVLAFATVAESPAPPAPVAAEVPPLGDAPTLADGAGLIISLGAGSTDFFDEPFEPDIPVQPRVGLAGYIEPDDAILLGVRVGASAHFRNQDVLPNVETAVGFAVGSRDRTVWTGGELGLSYTNGAWTNGRTAPIASATFGVDIDPLTSLGFRLGAALGEDGLEQRHGIVGTYRPAPRTGLSVGVHGGVAAGQHGLTAQLALHQRLGPLRDGWTEPEVVEEQVVTVEAQEHPELRCDEGNLPVGRPPPLGLEGWCARIARNGTPIRNGPYVRWHDMLTVAERGQYTEGQRSGDWEAYDHEGNVRERGSFVADKEEGEWVTYFADGSLMEEGGMRGGERDGRWRFYAEEGHLEVDGTYAAGKRVGLWVDYDAKGTAIRERSYEQGRMVRDERLVVEEQVEGDKPEIRNADGTVPQ